MPEAESLISIEFDNAVHPAVVVVLTVYSPSASTPTTRLKPVAPATGLPLRYQVVVLVGSAGVTVAVSVEVCPGIRLVGKVAVSVIVG